MAYFVEKEKDCIDQESENVSFRPVERKGNPLVCHLPGSSCKSKLRILTAAVAHYPKLAPFKKMFTLLVDSTLLLKILIEQLRSRTISHC